MLTIQWRTVVNALTKPLSCRILFVPRNTAGYDEMATDISSTHPNYNADLIRSLAPLIFDWILQRMSNGDQVTLKDAFRFCPAFTGRLNSPDDPLPDNDDMLGVNVYPSWSLLQRLHAAAKFTRLPMSQKQPLITSAEDTKIKLANRIIKQAVEKENSQGRKNLDKTNNGSHDAPSRLPLRSTYSA